MLIAARGAQRATRSAEEPFAAWYNLAQIASQREDYATTDSSLRKAIDAHPNWVQAALDAGPGTVPDGPEPQREAEQQAALAVGTGMAAITSEVAQTLRDIRALITGKISPN